MAKENVVIEGSDNITASQLKEFFKQVDNGSISRQILQIFLENKDVIELFTKLVQQDEYIKNMRDVLRFCARNDVGTFYQQQSAKEMLKGTKLVWSHCNPDGTKTEKQLDWVRSCGGQEAVDKVLEYEKELLSLSA